ncbi:MAG: amino acid ABC transporter substrate-binding protein [Proteobacteria bacterium]|nr:amino acid ABC transporter substrate-binding protein [Pseudomonadota bacterium]
MKYIKSLMVALTVVLFTSASFADTLNDVKARGMLKCGSNTGLVGFAAPDDAGVWKGVDVDVCRAVAAAVFGDANAMEVVPTTSKARFTVLQSGEIDMLARNTTWTFSRDVDLGLEFVGVNYYDGQGFLVPASLGVSSALDLDGASVCIQVGTTTELNLADFFRMHKMEYESIPVETNDEADAAFLAGRCDVYTTDQSGLYAQRSTYPNPDDWVVLPEIISKEPLGPSVRHGDSKWADVVRWSLNTMIIAEEMGITSANVDSHLSSDNPSILRLLGKEGAYGAMLGVNNDFGYQIIKQVGNYGESFERNIGLSTPMAIARGVNSMWTKGGLIYAPPFR